MSTFYVNSSQIKENKIYITGDDYNHLKNVLRAKIGENYDICDENAVRYNTKIVAYQENSVVCEIIKIDEKNTEFSINLTLYQGMPKADKLEYIIQKTTEMGINEVFPVQMERSIVKLDEKNIDKKTERWNKIAEEASKQSGRQKLPIIHRAINFKNIIENISKYDIVLLPYENEKSVTIKDALKEIKNGLNSYENNQNKSDYIDKNNINSIAIIIGPEGGFSEEEINTLTKYNNVHKVTLGPRILRTETAGIVTIAMIEYEFEM